MEGEQLSIYDIEYEKFKINKPIRLIELFAGYGSQALALKYLGVPFEHWKICEWAVKSIQAYKDIHFNTCYADTDYNYAHGILKEDLVDYLFNKGISSNYNEPMTKQQIERLSEEQLKTIYNNIAITHNLVNIQQVKGKDLKIVDTDKYDYILTYSFPCQDLSLAGKGKGMSDTSTRSGMLWEVERILTECKEIGTMPQILLMENVPQVHGADNVKDFNKWQLRLEELGYKSYFQDLIATDYGIPQTRNRCFMISILGDYSYTFPKPIPLKLKLKDMLEDNVDEKYYLSDAMIKCFTRETEDNKFPRGERFKQALKLTNEKNIAGAITTAAGNRATDNFILTKDTENYIEWEDGKNIQMNCRAWKDDKIVATLNTGGETKILETLKKDLCNKLIEDGLVEEGDVVKHSYTQQILDGNKKCVEKNDGNMITLTTRGDCVGVCVGTYQYAKSNNFMQGKDRLQLGKETSDTLQTSPKEGVVTIGNYSPSKHNASRIVDQEHLAPTVMENHGTITATNVGLRIRKLTPKEYFRLMGVKDEDYEKCARNQSDSSLYHLAGDSIVVNILMAIFKEMM